MRPMADQLQLLPDEPGVYLFRDEKGTILYVGKAISLKNRVRQYFHAPSALAPKVAAMVSRVHHVEWFLVKNEAEAFMLECTLIKQHRPHYNILLKDDKQYPFIRIDVKSPWPKATLSRQLQQDGAMYFGPYLGRVRDVLQDLGKIFPLRTCNKKIPPQGGKDRPCLKYQIGLCRGPCASLITPKDYAEIVLQWVHFLQGKGSGVIEELQHKMQKASMNMQYEQAGKIRDTIKSLERMMEQQKAVTPALNDRDAIALATQGDFAVVQVMHVRQGKVVGGEYLQLDIKEGQEKEGDLRAAFLTQYYAARNVPKEVLLDGETAQEEGIRTWLKQCRGTQVVLHQPQRGEKRYILDMARRNAAQALQRVVAETRAKDEFAMDAMRTLMQTLHLPTLPRRIEAYDISHLQGSAQVGGQVVFVDGKPNRKGYRKYSIKRQGQADDFASIKEVITRRLTRYVKGEAGFDCLPDVMLIDGGPLQLSAAQQGAAQAGVEVPIFALAKRLEEIFIPGQSQSILLPRGSNALHLVQQIRDEVHRFSITFHRAKRSKSSIHSQLLGVSGVGESRRKKIFSSFSTKEALTNASITDLATIGLPVDVAKAVWEKLHAPTGVQG